jgi:hypothetical protein
MHITLIRKFMLDRLAGQNQDINSKLEQDIAGKYKEVNPETGELQD